jgi:hypothetical protein
VGAIFRGVCPIHKLLRLRAGVFIALDAVGDVSLPHPDGTFTPSGFDINDVRFAYDQGSDTAFVGETTGELFPTESPGPGPQCASFKSSAIMMSGCQQPA